MPKRKVVVDLSEIIVSNDNTEERQLALDELYELNEEENLFLHFRVNKSDPDIKTLTLSNGGVSGGIAIGEEVYDGSWAAKFDVDYAHNVMKLNFLMISPEHRQSTCFQRGMDWLKLCIGLAAFFGFERIDLVDASSVKCVNETLSLRSIQKLNGQQSFYERAGFTYKLPHPEQECHFDTLQKETLSQHPELMQQLPSFRPTDTLQQVVQRLSKDTKTNASHDACSQLTFVLSYIDLLCDVGLYASRPVSDLDLSYFFEWKCPIYR